MSPFRSSLGERALGVAILGLVLSAPTLYADVIAFVACLLGS